MCFRKTQLLTAQRLLFLLRRKRFANSDVMSIQRWKIPSLVRQMVEGNLNNMIINRLFPLALLDTIQVSTHRRVYPFYCSCSLLSLPFILIVKVFRRALKCATTHVHTSMYTWQKRERSFIGCEWNCHIWCGVFSHSLSRRDLPICKWKQALASLRM
jgi:hypothetical protein